MLKYKRILTGKGEEKANLFSEEVPDLGKNKDYSRIFNEQAIPFIKQVSEGMPGGFFIYHADGDEELIYINSSILRIFDCENEQEFRDLTGFTFPGMVHPEDIEMVEESIKKQIGHSKYDLDYVEYRIIQKNGNIRWVEDYGHFFHTEEYGDIFCVFIEDATLRLKARMEELEGVNIELRNAYMREVQYKKAILYDALSFFEINLTKDSIIPTSQYQKKGEQLEELVFRPDSGQRYSDYLLQKKEVMSEEFIQFFDRERLILCYQKGQMEQTLDVWHTDQLGRKRIFHYIMLLGKDDFSDDIVALFMAKDITDQIEKQTLLKQALKQAESANMARNIFLSNMSHDIRTPLNAIIGYTDLIKQHMSDKEKLRDFVDKIRASGEQLLMILDESLQVTRMESGKVHLTKSECSLSDILRDVEETVHNQMQIKGLNFIMDQSGVKHNNVIADYIRIKEILCQLLDNAVKYSRKNGTVKLIFDEKEIEVDGYGKFIFIVEDDGIGISEDFAGDLFEPFKRENNTTLSGVPGTGLGLTVVKSLVDLMQGEIVAESERMKGSRFIVSLPLKIQEEQEAEVTSAEETVDQELLIGKRILLVEDNEINSEIAQELLISQGYVVETAENGQIALDMLGRSTPGYYLLVLMDIQMPVMDGYEATRKIRQMKESWISKIPIIALSANAFAEDYYNSLRAGMDAHFPKPLDINELQKLICSVLAMYQIEKY